MTVVVTNLEAKFSIDTSDIDRGVNHVTKQFHNLSSSAQSAVSGFSFGRVFEFATGGLLANGISNVVSVIGDLGSTALDSYAYTERLESSLQSLAAREFLKSGAATDMNQALEMGVKKAEELSTWIEKLAVQSPFKQSEVADSFRQAMNFGFAADEAQRLTKALIDFTAGSGNTGETMKRVAFALGQIRVNGRASADDLNQLTDAGLDVRTILAEAFGVTTAELRKMVSDGLVPADEAIEAITKSLENDFGGAALRQANSFSGLLSSLSDIKELGLRDFFTPMFKAAQPALQGFVEMLGSDSIKTAISSWGQSLGDFVGGAIEKAKNLMSILSSSNPFAAIGESLGADVQVLGSITSVKWGDFVGILNWNDYVISLRWKDFIATFNWKDSVTNLDWKGFIFAFDWNDWVGTFAWGDFVSIVDWSNWVYMISWGDFVGRIDLWNKVAGLKWGDYITSIDLSQDVFTLNWGDFVSKIDLGKGVASLVWGDFVLGVDLNLKATILQWGDYVQYWDWSTVIPELHWSDHTISLKWGDFIGVFNWSTWVATIVWGDYIDRISWSDVLPVINAWSEYIPQLLWVDHVSILRWNEFMGVFDWNTYVLTLSWGTYIQKLSWDSIITAISDWSNYISKLSWTEFIIQVLDWATWVPALVWNTFVKVIDLATYVVPLLWTELVSAVEWLSFVTPIVWNDYLEPLLWSAMVKVLEWNSYVSSLTWDDFLDALSWVSYVSSLTWDSFVSKLEWPKLITGLDLRSLIPSFPGWDYFFNWFGASAPSSTAVVNNGPGVTGNTPPSSPTVSPSVTPTPPNGRSLAVLNQQQPNIIININATVASDIDITQLAYQTADILKKEDTKMAHVFAITDGTTTITLNQTNGCMITGFDMNAAEVVFNEVNRTEVNEIERLNVTSTLDLVFTASTIAGIQTLVRNLEILLDRALLRQNKKNFNRVYLLVTIDGDVAWRSEILYFRLTPKTDLFDGITAKKTEYTLFITRKFYFEGPQKELEISNSGESAATGGIEIYNHNDAGVGHDNYVAIAAAQVGGVLPTPVKITLENTTGGNVGYRNFYLGNNAFSDPDNFTPIVEGESRETGFGTITSDSNSSGGQYNSYSFTDNGFIPFALTDDLLEQTQGRFFRLLCRFVGWSGTDIYITPELRDSTALITLWSGDEKKLPATTTAIQDLGSIPLPLGPMNSEYSDMTLVLKVRGTGSCTVNLDYIQLTPLDGYQYIIQRGLNILNSGTITFDGIEGIYHSDGQTIYSNRVGPLYVYPGKNQRIYILYDSSSGSVIANTVDVRVFIRERRLTI